MECLLVPVVRDVIILSVSVAQCRFRIELEVLAYEFLAFRHREHLISEASVVLVEEGGVGVGVCLVGRLSCIYLRVIHHPVMGLVVLCRVGYDIVLGNEPGIGAPFRVKLDDSILSACPFCCDEHYAVGSSCTVDGTGGGVFKDRHGLHIVRIDFRDGSVVWHSVHNVKRGIAGTHGADTPDADGGPARSRVSGRTYHLHSRGCSRKGAGHICHGPGLDSLCPDH